jgi:hypothetical protein
MFGITKQIEEIRENSEALGRLKAAQTVAVYRGEVDLTRAYTGLEVSRLLSDIVTILTLE